MKSKPKKQGIKTWHIYDRVYRIWLVYCEGNRGEFDKFIGDCGEDSSSVSAWALTITVNTNGNDFVAVWLPKRTLKTRLHELTHVAMMVFDRVGIPINGETHEAFAYYLEYLWHEVDCATKEHKSGLEHTEVIK